MDRPRAMRLDAAFGTTHRGGGLGDVEFFPVTQQEGFALTRGQRRHLGLDRLHDLDPRHRVGRALGAEHGFDRFESFEQVVVAVFACGVEVRQVLQHRIAHPQATEVVHRRVRQDALEQQRQLGRGTVGVAFGQPDHRVLDDVQRGVVVADGVHDPLEGALLDALEEVRQFSFARQGLLPYRPRPERRPAMRVIIASGRLDAEAARGDAIIRMLTERCWSEAGPPDRRGGNDSIAQAPTPPHEGGRQGHRWFFVREIHRGSCMEMSAADVKRAAMAHPNSPVSPPAELNGSQIVVRCLQAEGVKYVWGYPGGAVLYIYDELYKQDAIEHVLVRHEQAAVHAADGFARATGEVGVALVTSGPGVTNAVTGIATAYMDSIPLVVITGQVPTPAIGLDAFQECDTVGITRPVVKHNFLVKDVRDMATVMKKAFHIARSGRPGPVVVDIPKDVSFAKTAYKGYPETIEMRSYNPVRKGHSGQIRKALQLLLGAKRPYIYTGGGVLLANASAELRTLVDLLGAPVTHTLMGLGAFPASDQRFVGMLGMHGTWEANNAMQNCDVLLAVGARFDDRVIGNPKHFASVERKIIHIDIDPSSISKRVKVDVPIVGDVKDVLSELIGMLRESPAKPNAAALADWWKSIDSWRARDCLT